MNEAELLEAWGDNAASWTRAVRERKIASRVAVTDAAILEAVGPPVGSSQLLDLGCGEGWLTHALSQLGWQVVGVDAVAELIEAADDANSLFFTLSFDRLGKLPVLLPSEHSGRFAAIVANFSLLGETSVEEALRQAALLLEPGGRLMIQTLHPRAVPAPYRDGWRREDWQALGELDCRATPWYFRTLQSWLRLLSDCGFELQTLSEPQLGEEPVSLLLTVTNRLV